MSDFDQRLQLDQIRDGDRLDLSAGEAECASIAERLGLLSLDRLEAHAVLGRDGQRIRATGRIKAALEQACVATGEPVPAHVDEAFEILFLPEPGAGRATRTHWPFWHCQYWRSTQPSQWMAVVTTVVPCG